MFNYRQLISVVGFFFCMHVFSAQDLDQSTLKNPQPFGVNLAGAEFGGGEMPGEFGKKYIYPTEVDLDYFLDNGIHLIRLPFKWERLQHDLNASLNPEELLRLTTFMEAARERDMLVILDLHNYARRQVNGETFVIGTGPVEVEHLTDFWKRLAIELKTYKPTIYGFALMNEPYGLNHPSEWFEMAQSSIYGIREVDQETTILVGGNDWSSAERWVEQSDTLKYLFDPNDNLIFEAHVYFDNDASGAYRGSYDEEMATPYIGIERIQPFVNWLRVNDFRGFVGEYGVPGDDERWLVAMDNFLSYLQRNNINATYWAGGPWWGNYKLSIMPDKNGEKPQMKVFRKYLYTMPE